MTEQDWQALWDTGIGSRDGLNHRFYHEVAAALGPVTRLLGPPTVAGSHVREDSYGGGMFPPTYGVLVAWNAQDVVGRDGNADLVPVDLAKPSVGVLIGNYQNSTCVARVSPHPMWRITLSVFGNPRYHTMPQFVERCLETLDPPGPPAPRPVDMLGDKARMGIAAGWIRPPKGMI